MGKPNLGGLVLTRRKGERIALDVPGYGRVWVKVADLSAKYVRLQVAADPRIRVNREEIAGEEDAA